MTKRYREQGLNSPLYSSQYLADLLEAYPDNLKMFFVYMGEEIVALCIDCDYKERVIHWLAWPGSTMVLRETTSWYGN